MVDLTHALRAQDVLDGFESHQATGLKYAWLGEDGESAVVWGHGLTYDDVAAALDMDGDLDPEELGDRWMVALSHSQGCDTWNEDVCPPCREKRHDACKSTGCECAYDADHDLEQVSITCGCDQFAWWVEWLTTEEAIAAPAGLVIAVTEWSA